MSKVFTHGKMSITLQDPKPVYNSLMDLPNILVVLEDQDEEMFNFGLRVSIVGVSQAELRDTIHSPALVQELKKFLKSETGLDVVNFFPAITNLTYALAYPGIRMGDVGAAQQKQFAKMLLSPNNTVRMFRNNRNQELVGTMGIFGKWTCGEESGVFSIVGGGPLVKDITIGDPLKIQAELSEEFCLRWPLYPEAVFEIMSYEEVEPLLHRIQRPGSRTA